MSAREAECPACGSRFAYSAALSEPACEHDGRAGLCSECGSVFVIESLDPLVLREPTPAELESMRTEPVLVAAEAAVRAANELRGADPHARCWWCGKCGTKRGGVAQPIPPVGTPTVCALCLAFGVVTGSLRGTRAASAAERLRLAADPGVREHVAALRKLREEVRAHVQRKYGSAHPYPPEPTDADYDSGKRGFPRG